MKKVALFVNSLQKGGSERVMSNLAEYFHERNYEVLLVTQYKREVEYDISPEIQRVYSEPEADLLQGGRIHNFIERFKALRNIWKEHKPDVVLAFLGKNNLMAIATSFFLPVRVIVSVRAEPILEYPNWLLRTLAKLLFGLADGVVMQTQQALDFFPNYVKKKAKLIPNPINPRFMMDRYEGERENIIVGVARLDPTKNQQLLIRAFTEISDEFPETNLIIYGEGEEREALESLVKELHMESRITLPGAVTDILERIYKVRLYVLPSDTEGIPNAMMEAMALGLTVLATDCPCGGPAMLIKDGENGMLIPVGDQQAMVNGFRKILSDKEYADKLGRNANISSKELHPNKVNRQWEEYLYKIADK